MATAGFKTRGGSLQVGLEWKGLDAYVEVLQNLPDTMHRTILSRAVAAGGEPILKAGRTLAPRGFTGRHEVKGNLSVRIQRNLPLASTFIKKVKVFSQSNVGV